MFTQSALLGGEKLLAKPTSMTSQGGRKLYRHTSNMGTVIEFNDGSARKVLVLDAAYRSTKAISVNNTDFHLTKYANAAINTYNNWYINGSVVDALTDGFPVLTDSTLNTVWAKLIDVNTAKQNCDQILTIVSGDYAVQYCRSVKVNGTGCDLPNIQTLMRIFCEAQNLDNMDPTIINNPDKMIGIRNIDTTYWNIGGKRNFYSSTEWNDHGMKGVNYNGSCLYVDVKSTVAGVIPVLEL